MFEYILTKPSSETVQLINEKPHLLYEGTFMDLPPFFLMVFIGEKPAIKARRIAQERREEERRRERETKEKEIKETKILLLSKMTEVISDAIIKKITIKGAIDGYIKDEDLQPFIVVLEGIHRRVTNIVVFQKEFEINFEAQFMLDFQNALKEISIDMIQVAFLIKQEVDLQNELTQYTGKHDTRYVYCKNTDHVEKGRKPIGKT